MRLGQQAGLTDPGRKRRQNEDAYVIEPPLFAVADGMGGAQAGEVASRLAVCAFREYHDADDLPGEERVAAIIQEANRRIYERAQADTQVSGMGTTTTAALVEGARIAIGHVGDSRAYRFRGGELEQLTQDHSLVGDLMRSGRLTAAEARIHPQRSVITRALGTDADVDVDTFTVEAEPGDVYLLCSDGLTTMIEDDVILETLSKSASLERAGKALVQAANREGGDDNVTVVLFSFVGDDAGLAETVVIDGDGDGDGAASPDDLEDTLTGLDAPAHDEERSPETAVFSRDELERALAATDPVGPPPERERPSGWVPAEEARRARREERPRRRWPRRLLATLVALAVVTILVALAFWGLSNAHFVGAEEDGRLAVYQGIPWDVGDGVGFYRARYVSELQAVQLSPEERVALFDHDLVAYDVARGRLARFEAEGAP